MKRASDVKEEEQPEEASGLHRFRIDGRLGSGAFGTVYKDEDIQTGEITVLEGHSATVTVLWCHLLSGVLNEDIK